MDHLGHHYIVRNRRGDCVYYSCKYRVRFNCPGSIKRQDDVINVIREHNGHIVPVDNMADFRRTLVMRAVQDRTSLREIYDQEAASSNFTELEEMHLDGTFKCIPVAPPFHQLLTIHIIMYEKSIALAYVLMTHRRQALYEAVLQVLQEFAPTLQHLRIITDYERALRGALIVTYPAAEIVGCFFHYASAVWKMCARLGHIASLEHHPDTTKKAIKMTLALPLLPANAIEPGLDDVMACCHNRQINLQNLFAYIRR